MMIRRFDRNDYDDLHRLLSDPKVMQYLEPPFSEEKTEIFLNEAGLSENPLIYAVEKDGVFIGYVIYHDYDTSSVEIGWVLFPEYWRKGIASELTKELLFCAAADYKDAVIECVPEQEATKHIAEKFGFSFEGFVDGLNHYRYKRK